MIFHFCVKRFHAFIVRHLRSGFIAHRTHKRAVVTLGSEKRRNLPIPQLLGFITSLLRSDEKNSPFSKSKSISYYIALAEKAITKGDLPQAENYLNNALDVCDSTSTVGVSCVYDMLATLAFRQGDVAKATNIITNAIAKLKRNNVPQDDNSVVDFNLKLARLHEAKGDHNQAELTFKNCLIVQKNKYESGKRDEETIKLWINVLFWYGQYLKPLGRHQEASQCFQTAYTLSAHVSKIDSKQVMVMLYNLGEMAFSMGHYDDALRYLLNAVVIGRAVNSAELNTYFNKIGIIYMHKGIYEEAKKWCENALNSSRRWADKEVKKESEECLNKLKKFHNMPRVGGNLESKGQSGIENSTSLFL